MTTTVTHNEVLPAPIDIATLSPGLGFANGAARLMVITQAGNTGVPGSAFDLDAKTVVSTVSPMAVDPIDLSIVISNPASVPAPAPAPAPAAG